jgi:hypothetical protein
MPRLYAKRVKLTDRKFSLPPHLVIPYHLWYLYASELYRMLTNFSLSDLFATSRKSEDQILSRRRRTRPRPRLHHSD